MHLLTGIRTPRERTQTQCVSILPLTLRHRDIVTYMPEALIPSINYVDCVRASGTYVTMSQGQWQHTQQYTTTYVYVVVGAYACCHLSRYIVSVMSCTLVLSPQLFLHHSESQYSTECFNLMSDYDLRIPYFRSILHNQAKGESMLVRGKL